MATFGQRLLEARKRKGMSQEELADKIGTKGPAIGRYERDAAKPILDTIIKIAGVLEISADYLLGMVDKELDKTTLDRIVELQQLPKDIQEKLFYFIDISIRDHKAKQAYS